MSSVLLTYGPAAAAWAALLYTFPILRRRRHEPGMRAYWLTLLPLTLGLTALLPPIYLAIDHATGVPNLARLLANSLALVATWALQRFLAHLSGADESLHRALRRRGWALLGVLALMTGLFVAAPVDTESLDFTRRYGDAPFVAEYRLVFLSYVALAMTPLARHTWRYAAAAARPSLRLGLRLVALGGIAGLGYTINEGLFVLTRRLGLASPISNPRAVSEVLVTVAVTLVTVGSTMPTWGPRLGVPWLCRWVDDYRSLRRLYPLWHALYCASPEIALAAPGSSITDTLSLRDLDFRLYRRVIEIHDGHLVLRPYIDPRAVHLAREYCKREGLPADETRAVVEAAGLATALRAKEVGGGEGSARVRLDPPGGVDVASDAAELERVARCFRRSRIVRAVLKEIERQELPQGDGEFFADGGGR